MSSLGGSSSCGKRSRSAPTVSLVSSTDSVVWDSQATLAGSLTWTVPSSGPSTRWMCSGASPGGADDLLVPLVADEEDVVALRGEPAGLVVHLRHQRAGRVDRLQAAVRGLLVDPGATPWAEKTTIAPSGTSSVSSTKIAPRCSSFLTTWVLCTICLRT